MNKVLYILICLIIVGSMALYLYMGKDEQLEMMDQAVKGAYIYVSPVPNTPQSTESSQIRLQKQIESIDGQLNGINLNDFNGTDLSPSQMGI